MNDIIINKESNRWATPLSLQREDGQFRKTPSSSKWWNRSAKTGSNGFRFLKCSNRKPEDIEPENSAEKDGNINLTRPFAETSGLKQNRRPSLRCRPRWETNGHKSRRFYLAAPIMQSRTSFTLQWGEYWPNWIFISPDTKIENNSKSLDNSKLTTSASWWLWSMDTMTKKWDCQHQVLNSLPKIFWPTSQNLSHRRN